jgi:hypothetical protein
MRSCVACVTFLEKVLHGDPTMLRGFGAALGDFSVNFFLAVLILIGAIWAAGWAAKLVEKGIARLNRRHGPDPTLQSFASSVTRYLVIIVGLIAVLQQVGVRTTSIIAVLGAASLAVGLALQGALGNVAAGVMLLLFRPYRVGDDIEIGGKRGRVKALDLFVTELATDDNVRIMAPQPHPLPHPALAADLPHRPGRRPRPRPPGAAGGCGRQRPGAARTGARRPRSEDRRQPCGGGAARLERGRRPGGGQVRTDRGRPRGPARRRI